MASHPQHVDEFLAGGRRTQEEVQRAHIAALLAIDDMLRQLLQAVETPELIKQAQDEDE